ncbi:hypothetical protein HK097_001816 [Rhizophlyctis rosea]|uniref:Superoxide dismutase copper/zinc binding domain-containing protein n=1 Tax=Rhizophlyctis rosea TaxID=64517 RepID=A0AAD5S657_9FUNG|nr:hypothetical protein HK097_001816 [Rhizophlyctis rosea]
MHAKSILALALLGAASVSAQESPVASAPASIPSATPLEASPTASAPAESPAAGASPTMAMEHPKAVAILHNSTVHLNVTFVHTGKGTEIYTANHLPETGGPFQFHIHQNPVTNNNCSATGGHLNPYGAVIAQSKPGNLSSYEIGDLSGKWGNLTAHKPDASAGNTTDPHMISNGTLANVDPSFSVENVIGLSVVVHNSTGARIGCANIYAANATGHPIEAVEAGFPVAFPAAQANVSSDAVGQTNVTGHGSGADAGGHAEGHSGAGVNVVGKVLAGVAAGLALAFAAL